MFHYMPQRITAHVKLCVLSLMIRRAVELATELPWKRLTTILAPLKAYISENRTIVQATQIRPETAGRLVTSCFRYVIPIRFLGTANPSHAHPCVSLRKRIGARREPVLGRTKPPRSRGCVFCSAES